MDLTLILDVCSALAPAAPDSLTGIAGATAITSGAEGVAAGSWSASDAPNSPNPAAGAPGAAGASSGSGGGGGGDDRGRGNRNGRNWSGSDPRAGDLGRDSARDISVGAALAGGNKAPGVGAAAGTALTVIMAAGAGAEGIIHIKNSKGVYGRNSNAGRQAMEAAGVTW